MPACPPGRSRPAELRLAALLIVAPFVLSAIVAQSTAAVAGSSMALAAVCATFAMSWMLALFLNWGVSTVVVSSIVLVIAPVLVGVASGLTGGFGGPAACLLLAVGIECHRVTGSTRLAASSMGVGIAIVAATQVMFSVEGASPSAWHWLSPLAYAAIVAIRRHGGPAQQASAARTAPETFDARLLDAFVIKLSGAGEVESVEGRGDHLLNVEPSLLLGTGLFERVHVADRVAFLRAISEAQHGTPQRVEVKLRKASDPLNTGVSTYHLFEMETVCGSDRVAVWAVLREAGTLATLRGDLARALEEANATEIAKGRFLATVSHELRTPLNAIIGFSDMLLHREISGELTAKQAEHVGLIREAGNHLLSVVNAILDVSKIESGSYQITVEPFDLRPAVDLCCAMLEPQAVAKGVALTAKLPQAIGKVSGDQRAVQQILFNLLSNAIKFTPEGGSITVNATAKDGMVRLFVNDTGIGIAGDDLARIGQPFMQVRNDYTRQFQGTGLGLSVVKGLVRLHGGSMTIESAPGLGTTVCVGLPMAAEDGGTDMTLQGDEDGTALRRIA